MWKLYIINTLNHKILLRQLNVTSGLYKLAYENGIHKLADEFHTSQSTSINCCSWFWYKTISTCFAFTAKFPLHLNICKSSEVMYVSDSEQLCCTDLALKILEEGKCHTPNPKGSEAWERHLKVPVDFFFFFFSFWQSNPQNYIKNYHNNSIEYTLRVSQSSK